MKHKVGDTVRITKNKTNHFYPSGYETEIMSIYQNGYWGEKFNGDDWHFTDEECEAIEPVSNAKPIGTVNPEPSQIYAMGIKDGLDMALGMLLITWTNMGIGKDGNELYKDLKRRLEEKAKQY